MSEKPSHDPEVRPVAIGSRGFVPPEAHEFLGSVKLIESQRNQVDRLMSEASECYAKPKANDDPRVFRGVFGQFKIDL